MIPCYCTNMIGNKKIHLLHPKFLVVLHFYDHILHICLVNVNCFTFYHSNDGSVGIPIPENIEIDTSFVFLCQLLMILNLGFGHFMDTRGKIELGTISKIV